jgi:signal transduction histidine kinase/HAMP domain-containing protein
MDRSQRVTELASLNVTRVPFWRRFRTRLLAWLVGLSVATSMIAGYVYYRRQMHFVAAEQSLRGHTLISQLASQSELGAYSKDRTFLLEPAQRAFSEPDVSYVVIYDAAGGLLLALHKPDAPLPAALPNVLLVSLRKTPLASPRYSYGENHIDFYAPVSSSDEDPEQALFGAFISGNPKMLGVARLGLSRHPARQKLKEVLAAGIQVALVILGMGIIVALFLARRISEPIMALARGADEVRTGGLGYQIDLRRSDELGVLASSFNRMSEQLQQTVDSLNHLNRNLEVEVNRRTLELRRSRDFIVLLTAPLRLNELLDTALGALLQTTEAVAGAIYLKRRDGTIETVVSQGAHADAFRKEGPSSRTAEKLHCPTPISITKHQYPALSQACPNASALLWVPLRHRRRLQAVVALVFAELHIGAPRIDFVDHAGSQLAIALSNALAYADVERLARELEQRNVALLQQRDKLQEVSRLKSEFLASISHELRTPLNAVTGYTELMQEGVFGQLTAEQLQSLDGIAENATNLLVLINQLLDLSKVEAGRMTVARSRVELVSLARDVLETAAPLVKDKPYDLTLRPHAKLMRLTDGPKVRQILVNLLSNAIKFTAEGHVELSFEEESSGTVRIRVSDSGIGIAEKDQELIFDQFRQVDGSTTREHGGTGLGLAISRKLAQLIGGEIEVESVLGEGSTFTLVLPAESSPQAAESLPEIEVSVESRLEGSALEGIEASDIDPAGTSQSPGNADDTDNW